MPLSFPRDTWPIENPEERHLPAAIILDVVGKNELYATELTNAFIALQDAINQDSLARGRMELCIIINVNNGLVQETFRAASDYLEIPDDYIANIMKVTQMQPANDSMLDGSINLALNLINSRLNQYREIGISSYKPWILVFSDGKEIILKEETILEFRNYQSKNVFQYMPVGIGKTNSSSLMKLFASSLDPFTIAPSKESFSKAFAWWAKSMCINSYNLPISIPDYLDIDPLGAEMTSEHAEDNTSKSNNWIESVKKTVNYIDTFIDKLKENNMEYHDIWDDDTGSVTISLNDNNYMNRIRVHFTGKAVVISSEDKWSFSVQHLDKYNLGKYKLLKSSFELDLQSEKLFMTFEHATYLHAEPDVFCEYIMMLIKKFDIELSGFVSDNSLDIVANVNLPPTPSIVTVGI